MKKKKLVELIHLLKQLDDDLIKCMKCGMCQGVCPLYKTTHRETDVARGKLALIYHLIKELLKDPEGVKDTVNRCLLCGSCAANCPSGVDVLKIFLKTRIVIANFLRLSLIEKAILKGIVANPKLFNTAVKIAARLQQPFIQEKNPTLGSVSCSIPFIKDRFFVPPTKKTFHERIHKKQNIKHQKINVGIFPGCLVDKFFPNIGISIISILEEVDIGYFIPEIQICCGIPAVSSGDIKSFKTMVTQLTNVYPLNDIDYLVTPCATCTSIIKKIWPMFAHEFESEIKEKILLMSSKTMDINDFLINKTDIYTKFKKSTYENNKIKITYHDPCHLRKSLGVYREPREILKLNNAYQLVEMEDPDMCCGMGGSFNIKYYELSKKIGENKANNIIKTKAKVVATSCPACMLQLINVLSHMEADISVKHPVEILEQTLTEQKENHD